jgi:hypothetical protein
MDTRRGRAADILCSKPPSGRKPYERSSMGKESDQRNKRRNGVHEHRASLCQFAPDQAVRERVGSSWVTPTSLAAGIPAPVKRGIRARVEQALPERATPASLERATPARPARSNPTLQASAQPRAPDRR